MKIFIYNNNICSLENVAKITQASDKVLHISYIDQPGWHAISFKSKEDLERGIKEIAEILRGSQASNDIIVFDNFCFDKKYFICAKPFVNNIYIYVGSEGGEMHETSLHYSSEKKCQEKFAELLKMIR